MILSKRCLFIAIIIPFLSYTAFAEQPVKIAIDEWTPYLSKSLKDYGIAAHIVKDAFEMQGMDVAIEFIPWKRVLVDVKNRIYDASMLWVWTEDRACDFYFTEVFIEGQAVFFHLKDYPFKWNDYVF